MKKTRKGKKSKNIVLRVAVVALSVYMVTHLGIMVSEIVTKQKELADKEQALYEEKQKHEVLRIRTENVPEHLEQKAREQGKLKPGETMYYEIAND